MSAASRGGGAKSSVYNLAFEFSGALFRSDRSNGRKVKILQSLQIMAAPGDVPVVASDRGRLRKGIKKRKNGASDGTVW